MTDSGPVVPTVIGTLVPPSPITPGNPFTDNFAPTEPCRFAVSCSFEFSFSGSSLDSLGNTHDTFAFTSTPSSEPSTAPLNFLINFIPQDPCLTGTGCEVTGPIFAFSTGTQVGTWDVTINQTPLPAALPLFATGIGALGLLGWRRKGKARAVA